MTEAAGGRLIYCVSNLRRNPLPTNAFGDVSVVFSPSLVADAALFSPTDTGDYEVGCNHTRSMTSMCWPANCKPAADCASLADALGGQPECAWHDSTGSCIIPQSGPPFGAVNCTGW